MGKGKANKTAPKPAVVVEASAAATAKREGNTVMTSFFHPAAVEKRRGRKKKAKTEAEDGDKDDNSFDEIQEMLPWDYELPAGHRP